MVGLSSLVSCKEAFEECTSDGDDVVECDECTEWLVGSFQMSKNQCCVQVQYGQKLLQQRSDYWTGKRVTWSPGQRADGWSNGAGLEEDWLQLVRNNSKGRVGIAHIESKLTNLLE